MSAHEPHDEVSDNEDEDAMLDPAEAEEEIEGDEDVEMGSDNEEDQEIQLQNDSVAHFDVHNDSIFCIAQHPIHPEIVATGGGDDVGYIFDSTPAPSPVLPASYETTPQSTERAGLEVIQKLDGHTDSLNAIAFTLPKGEYVASAGLDGQVRVWQNKSLDGRSWSFVTEAKEVEEINWMIPCPSPEHPNTIAFGALDGSVWVYEINAADKASPLTIVQAFYLNTSPSTAGAWTSDGKLLATVSEDGSLYVWDVWGDAAAAGFITTAGAQYVIAMDGSDERFKVEGGLFSVAISPGGGICAVGGAGGMIRVVGLPRFGAAAPAKGKAGKQSARGGATASLGQTGQILASTQVGEESVETLAFGDAPITLMAAGSVDGSIVLFDAAHNFAVRRRIPSAHEEEAVIKVEFVKNSPFLTSCGNDGVIRRWDTRGGTAAAGFGLSGEWKGHIGGGEGGGILGFVQGGGGGRVITAGDDHLSLVFNTPLA